MYLYLCQSVGSFFSYVNDAWSHEPEACLTLLKIKVLWDTKSCQLV